MDDFRLPKQQSHRGVCVGTSLGLRMLLNFHHARDSHTRGWSSIDRTWWMDGTDIGENEITNDARDKSCYLLFMNASTTKTNPTIEFFFACCLREATRRGWWILYAWIIDKRKCGYAFPELGQYVLSHQCKVYSKVEITLPIHYFPKLSLWRTEGGDRISRAAEQSWPGVNSENT